MMGKLSSVLSGKMLLGLALFVISGVFLGVKLFNPANIHVYIEGNQTLVIEVPGYYTGRDVGLLVVFSLLFGSSGMFLVMSAMRPMISLAVGGNIVRWRKLSLMLKESEKVVYDVIMDAGGVLPQSEIVQRTRFSKSQISRILDVLESKGLVERRRKGLTNIVILK